MAMINELLQQTHDAVMRMEGRLEAGDARFERIEKEMEKQRHTLHGNGKPGLASEVAELKRWKQFWIKLGWLCVGAVAPILGAGAIAGVLYLVKHAG